MEDYTESATKDNYFALKATLFKPVAARLMSTGFRLGPRIFSAVQRPESIYRATTVSILIVLKEGTNHRQLAAFAATNAPAPPSLRNRQYRGKRPFRLGKHRIVRTRHNYPHPALPVCHSNVMFPLKIIVLFLYAATYLSDKSAYYKQP